VILSTATLIALAMLAALAAWGWAGWLRLKLRELDGSSAAAGVSAHQRIDLADLKERIRKLEAIAAGVEL
jgi:cytochrome b